MLNLLTLGRNFVGIFKEDILVTNCILQLCSSKSMVVDSCHLTATKGTLQFQQLIRLNVNFNRGIYF